MPYHYLPDIAIADVAFEAWDDSLIGVFLAAAEATMNVMVSSLDTILEREMRTWEAEESDLDMLLFQLLQELIFYKDAEQLLLRVKKLEIRPVNNGHRFRAEAWGEKLDPARHDLVVDVKAVTLHRFCLEPIDKGWKATVILDI